MSVGKAPSWMLQRLARTTLRHRIRWDLYLLGHVTRELQAVGGDLGHHLYHLLGARRQLGPGDTVLAARASRTE